MSLEEARDMWSWQGIVVFTYKSSSLLKPCQEDVKLRAHMWTASEVNEDATRHTVGPARARDWLGLRLPYWSAPGSVESFDGHAPLAER